MTAIVGFEESTGWTIVNDGVMGGVSRSSFHAARGVGRFEGVVWGENNGGFASVRTNIEPGYLTGATALGLRVRGDGKRYQLRVRMGQAFDGIAYKHEFVAPPTWQRIELRLSDFRATYRGRDLQDVEPLAAREIGQVGFLIAGKQFGRFSLEVSALDAIR
jgi:NADH dehydrogenase [ubiquinone] 1 alpha subcomplex assembly factor 1